MSENILTGGTWQAGPRGVLTWVRHIPDPSDRLSVAGLIACPTCRARVDQTCRSSGGNPREPHVTRLVPRLCSCGARLGHKKQMCGPCAEIARRQTYKLRERRKPTRTRRRAA